MRADRIQGQRNYKGTLTVPCVINQIYRRSLLVDTGAAVTAISQRITLQMGFDITKPLRWLEVLTAQQVICVPVVRLNSLQVGGYQQADLEVTVVKFPPRLNIDGLLGINFLEHFRPTFEFDQATLILRPVKK